MRAQPAITAVVQYRQRVDGAVQRQLAPQTAVDIADPADGNAGAGQFAEPVRCGAGRRGAEPGMPLSGEDHLKVVFAVGPFGAAGADALAVWQQVGHCLLAAQAVLQQDHLAARQQARGHAGNGIGGVIGLAGQQQAANRQRVPGEAGRQGMAQRLLALAHLQATGAQVVGQTLFVAQNQLDAVSGGAQPGGPEAAQAAGAQQVPAHALPVRRSAVTRPLL